jgi:hypothetical protein
MRLPKATDLAGQSTPLDLEKLDNPRAAASDGAVTEGAVTEGAVTEGAVTEGAATDDAFGLDRPSRDVPLAKKRPGIVGGMLQALGLRSTKKEAPKTQGAGQAVFGAELHAKKKRGGQLLKAAVIATLLFFGATAPHEISARTLHVNVNGVAATSAEILGAKKAADHVKEPFTTVKPPELPSVLEQANQPDGKLRKLILSGHSSGLWLSGRDGNETYGLSHDEMKAYAERYPSAFAKVQFLFAMACKTGTEEYSRQWMQLFPKLYALVGFDDLAPFSHRPAAGAVLIAVDAELQKVDWKNLNREGAKRLAVHLSQLPGVKQTEFSVRLRIKDGTNFFYSKKNQPTSLSAAKDLVNQHRATGFEPWLEATDARFADPPADHGPTNPVRPFYNASHTLLSSVGRELIRKGEDPVKDPLYQATETDKEIALRLIYWHVVVQNAEFHKRPLINTVLQQFKERDVALEIPNLTTLTRAQIVKLSFKLERLGNYTLNNFASRHAADLDIINAHLNQVPNSTPLYIGDIEPHYPDWKCDQMATHIRVIINADDTPDVVKQAGQRMIDGLKQTPSAEFVELQRLFNDGLVRLNSELIPPQWVTTERPNS